MPLLLIVPPAPPATTVHVAAGDSVVTLPFASRAVAVNCWLAFVATDAGLGVTVMVAAVPGVTVTVANLSTLPFAARTVFVNVPATVPAVRA